MTALRTYLNDSAVDGLISWSQQKAAAEEFKLTVAEVEAVILQIGLLPVRYQRNQQMISTLLM